MNENRNTSSFSRSEPKEHADEQMQNEVPDDNAKIVLPGEVIADTMDILAGKGTFREGSKIFSKYVGVARNRGSVISVTPLAGAYMPQEGDYVVGEVTLAGFSNWGVDIRAPYDAGMSPYDVNEYVEKGVELSKYYKVGELIFARISKVTSNNFVNVATKDPKCRKLMGGIVVEISPAKVPRLIGKAGSMISLIKNKTGCMVTVGQNGRVWVKGDNDTLAIEAIKKVEELAHTHGLTDKMDEFLTKRLVESGKKI